VSSSAPANNEPQADRTLVLAFVTQVRQVLASPTYRPPLLPTVALEVHKLSYRADVNADQLVAVLEQDAVLAAQVLRVAGSAAYGGWGDGEVSLRQAVVRLGMRNLAILVWEVATGMRIFRSARYSTFMEEMRRHSTACAHLCRLIATRKGVAADTAFLCGLLHDIGMAATLLVLAERPKDEPAIAPPVLDEILRETHQEVSGMIAQLWKLPAEIADVLANHHSGQVRGQPNELAAIVAICEEMSRDLGCGVNIGAGRCDHVEPDVIAAAFASLALGDDVWRELGTQARKAIEALGHAPAEGSAAPNEKVTMPAKSSQALPAARPQARRSWWQRLKNALFG
jgi:putative nucleotidyltransferase with HDIG domain